MDRYREQEARMLGLRDRCGECLAPLDWDELGPDCDRCTAARTAQLAACEKAGHELVTPDRVTYCLNCDF